VGGLLVMVGTDAVLLEIEEAVSRDAFEADIRAALDEAEAETLALIDGAGTD
jgi:chromosome condensin MukBEF MukE localization factor